MDICHGECQVSFCACDNVEVVAAGRLICNHVKNSGVISIIRQLYLIFFFFPYKKAQRSGAIPKTSRTKARMPRSNKAPANVYLQI